MKNIITMKHIQKAYFTRKNLVAGKTIDGTYEYHDMPNDLLIMVVRNFIAEHPELEAPNFTKTGEVKNQSKNQIIKTHMKALKKRIEGLSRNEIKNIYDNINQGFRVWRT